MIDADCFQGEEVVLDADYADFAENRERKRPARGKGSCGVTVHGVTCGILAVFRHCEERSDDSCYVAKATSQSSKQSPFSSV